jgi:uncharacterized protein with FMN-binding domain
MKRAVVALVTTLAGVVWLVSFKTSPEQLAVAAATPVPDAPTSSPSPEPSVSASATPIPTPTPANHDGAFTGPVEPNFYGDVQVKVTIKGGRIADVQALQLPNDRSRSAYISQVAGPMLRTEVIQAQSAQIDIISGATYTSEGYAQSVAAALKDAHFRG